MPATPSDFASRLQAAIDHCQTPLIVGIDPRWDRFPPEIQQRVDSGLPVADACELFAREIIDIAGNRLPACKPQFAFFEQLGPAGLSALKRIVEHARAQGMLVIGDAKRGDIGSTAEAYARAYLDPNNSHGIPCDALTVNPYMGFDTVDSFLQIAEPNGNGLFVLVKTSNPGSGDLQDLATGSRTLFEHVAQKVETLNATGGSGPDRCGPVGAVVGATYPEQLTELRARMPHTLFLIPGFGAQGGTAADVAGGFLPPAGPSSPGPRGAIINSSRGILYAWQNPRYSEPAGDDWRAAVDLAITESINQIRNAWTAAGG